MKTTFRLIYLLVLAMWAFCPVVANAAEKQLTAFSLEGHDGQTYTERSWPDHALVLFLSTRDSAVHNEQWVWSKPVATFFQESSAAAHVTLVRIVNLSAVPRMFRGVSRSMVLETLTPTGDDPLRLSLLDWNGDVSEFYGLADDAYNVLVFDRQNQLLFSTALRTFDEQGLASLLQELAAIPAQL